MEILMILTCLLGFETEYLIGDGPHCNATWNEVSCWPPTPAGYLAVVACPQNWNGVDPNKNASRFCYTNGSWASVANYNNCLLPIVKTPGEHLDEIEIQVDVASNIIYYVGYIISTITLIIALSIFMSFRSLRCLKNFIHCHLLFTFILRNVVWIIMQHSLTAIINAEQTWACQMLVAIFNYAQVTNFSWMLVEGLYLHIIVVWTYTADRIRKWYFVVIGWGVPATIVLAWVIARLNAIYSVVNAGHRHVLLLCWLPTSDLVPHIEKLDYIYIIPILMVLAINILFLASIIWVLVTKLRATNSWETQQLRKAIKATLLLFPLLGITYMVFLTTPNKGGSALHAHKIVNAFLQSFQGFFVSLFYCFLNEEVKSVLRRKLPCFRSLTRRYSRSSMAWTRDSVLRKESVPAINGRITNQPGKVRPKYAATEISMDECKERENML